MDSDRGSLLLVDLILPSSHFYLWFFTDAFIRFHLLTVTTASPIPSTGRWLFRLCPGVSKTEFASATGPQFLVWLIAWFPRAVRPGFVIVAKNRRVRIHLCRYCHLRSFRSTGICALGHARTTVELPREASHPAQAVSPEQIPRSLGLRSMRNPRHTSAEGRGAVLATRTALSGGLQGENKRRFVTTLENQDLPTRRAFRPDSAASSAARKLFTNSSACFSASSRAMP